MEVPMWIVIHVPLPLFIVYDIKVVFFSRLAMKSLNRNLFIIIIFIIKIIIDSDDDDSDSEGDGDEEKDDGYYDNNINNNNNNFPHFLWYIYVHWFIWYILLCIHQIGTGTYQRLVYTVPSGKPVTENCDIQNITWATWTRYVRPLMCLWN